MFELGMRPVPEMSLDVVTHPLQNVLTKLDLGNVISAVTIEFYSYQPLCIGFQKHLKGTKFLPEGISREFESEGMRLKSNLNDSHD